MGQRKVLIGTPSYDGTLDVWYVNSLVGTIRESEDRGIRIDPIYMSFDALVQRARNDLVALAIEHGYDELIFIDGDIEWDPSWIFQLLKYKHDVVGGTYRKKTDDYEGYVLKPTEGPEVIDTRTGLVKVAGLGTGFMKLSRKALEHLWNQATPYVDHKGKNSRMVFDIAIQNGVMVSEDILMCQKLTQGGFDIWLDPRMCCNHTGPKKFTGNFGAWLAKHHHEFWMNLWEELKDTTLSKIMTHHKWVEYWKPTMTYLKSLKDGGFEPKIIYDIGACWGEWSAIAKHVWPNAKFFLFEGCDDKRQFLRRRGKFHIDVLSDKDDKEVKFYINDESPGGNSYYIEQTQHYSENKYITVNTRTLDSVVKEREFPLPELVKLDVQGAEIDILCGATSTLQNVKHLLVELQHVQYNKGALLVKDSLPIIESLGFKCIAPLFTNNGPDGDYGFIRE